MVVSPGGQTLYSVDPDGKMWRYDADQGGYWVDAGSLQAGQQLAAVSDDGAILLRTDGVLQMWGNITTPSLSTLLPATHVAGGYGLTPDGHYALIYGYRISNERQGDRARDAAVWVVDLRGMFIIAPNGARIAGMINLADALGCTGALSTGETCRHTASVTSDASGGTAFVLGPRGVAAVSLSQVIGNVSAASASTSQAASVRAQAQSIRVQVKRIGQTMQVIRH
jgi:hypothetical protein